ncbi:MAG: autotransporter domain-containing protein, partial [Candidatus Omnitrophica bacterium]|nr:autotransporter domain-containing protein [Candidatus Omnitrophota bacterium]
LKGWTTSSNATGVSSDGGVVVGNVAGGGWSQAFRWTQADGMEGLGFLTEGSLSSSAYDISGDGNVIVGYSYSEEDGTQAFRWTAADGMQAVSTWLTDAGVSIPADWILTEANATNTDGSVVAGTGEDPDGNNQSWLARVSDDGDGFLPDTVAFNNTLIETGSLGVQAGAGLSHLVLFGSHHRSLLDSGLARTKEESVGIWTTTDAAHYDNTHTSMALTEIGVYKDVATARVGIGVGQEWANQNWSLDGGAKYDGQYLFVEGANTFGEHFEGSVAGYYGWFETKLDRHYVNGANVDSSVGKPDTNACALRVRIDWKDATKLVGFHLSPYVVYTWSQTKLDAYTETGGGFPAQFSSSTWRTNDVRLGVAARTALSGLINLRLGLEAVHRFEDSASGSSGQAIGLWSFNLPGQSIDQTWGRATVDVDRRLSDTVALTLGVNAATSGGDPTYGVTAGVRANF